MTDTRRRGRELEEAILAAGWEQLLKTGHEGFSVEAVTERAQTGKAAVYRRWPNRQELLLAVLRRHYLAPQSSAPATGSLRGDLLHTLRSFNTRFGDISAPLFSAIVGLHFDDPRNNPAQFRDQLLRNGPRQFDKIFATAVERGELGSAPSPRVATLGINLLRHEILLTLAPVSDEFIVETVDTLVLPLLDLRAG